MNQAIKKIISIFLLAVFLSGAGAGQLVHSIFHKHPVFSSSKAPVSLSTPHTYCNALQLMLPEFSGSNISCVPATPHHSNSLFAWAKVSLPHFYFFKTSDRAPPVLA